MEEKNMVLDKELDKDIKDCKQKAEMIEKFLIMLVKGFVSEY